MIYYVEGPYSDPYIVEANTEQEALNKCYEYETMTWDFWAISGYNDDGEWEESYFPCESDFEIITKEEFDDYYSYNNLVNYDLDHQLLKPGIECFCKKEKNKHYELHTSTKS